MEYRPMKIHHVLITAGLAILIFSLIKIWQASAGLPEQAHYHDEKYEDMELDRLKRANGRADWITVEGRVG